MFHIGISLVFLCAWAGLRSFNFCEVNRKECWKLLYRGLNLIAVDGNLRCKVRIGDFCNRALVFLELYAHHYYHWFDQIEMDLFDQDQVENPIPLMAVEGLDLVLAMAIKDSMKRRDRSWREEGSRVFGGKRRVVILILYSLLLKILKQ